ncbi:MAG TPA: hypothetical protein VFU10_14025 [Gaiellaceae bacterium]|nr:hypothetical protein [Gaiellaceae bacterium]
MSHEAAVARARARLEPLRIYPSPIRDDVRVVVLPLWFRLPFMRRYVGYALIRTILLKRDEASDDLITHELCHIWQFQHRPVHMCWTYLTTRYGTNPYEVEARAAVDATR